MSYLIAGLCGSLGAFSAVRASYFANDGNLAGMLWSAFCAFVLIAAAFFSYKKL